MKYYLPNEVTSNNCAYMYDKDTIRVYEEVPRANSTINYTDYFINTDYYTRSGSTTFGQWTNFSNDCLDYRDFTTNSVYRLNFFQIIIIAFALIFVPYYFIRTLVRRIMYGRKTT